MFFAQTPGYFELKQRLIGAVKKGQVAHGLLFAGAEGAPIVPLSLAFARYLYCQNRGEDDSCGKCHPCHMMDGLVHPDLLVQFPVSKSDKKESDEGSSDNLLAEWRKFILQFPFGRNQEWVESYSGGNRQPQYVVKDTRSLLQRLTLKSYEGSYKIVFMWAAEMMKKESANAMLKVLEEPGENTIFILTTYAPEQLLPTILSRTQFVRVRPWEKAELAQYLELHHNIVPEKARHLAAAANGNMRQALALMADETLEQDALFFEWMRACYSHKHSRLLVLADRFAELERESQKVFLVNCLTLLRQCLRHHMGLPMDDLPNRDTLARFAASLSLDAIEPMSQKIEEAAYLVERNMSPKLLFISISLQIMELAFRKHIALV